jgi:peptidoglycan/xylan/chitin deacetylase (PgdA/CDA1 family)
VIVRERTGMEMRMLALTFDDEPSELTEPIIDLLAAHDARATFVVVGSTATCGDAR